MKKVIIGFGLLITALLILFWVASIYHLYYHIGDNFWVAVFSILFLLIGIVLSRKLFTPTLIVTREKPSVINKEQLIKSGISKQEAMILALMQEGLSNRQIAAKLFISENTVKKHISNIFQKLRVERRTEAIKKALELSVAS